MPCIDPTGYTQKLSLLEHQINLRLQRNYINNSVDLVSLARVRIAINNRIEQEIKVIKNWEPVKNFQKFKEYSNLTPMKRFLERK